MPLEFSVTGDPSALPSAENCTDPVGVPDPVVRTTVAARVTVSPTAAFVGDVASVVAVLSFDPLFVTKRVANPDTVPAQVTA
jgi:hypothetical protein